MQSINTYMHYRLHTLALIGKLVDESERAAPGRDLVHLGADAVVLPGGGGDGGQLMYNIVMVSCTIGSLARKLRSVYTLWERTFIRLKH